MFGEMHEVKNMKLEIELDLNQIDYNAINKQIAEKVAELNIREAYDIDSKINNAIFDLVNKEVDDSYNQYIDKYWSGTTSEGRKLIESMSKAEIEKRVKQVIEQVFVNDCNEDTLREAMLKVLPEVFTSILFSRMESTLFTSEYDYYSKMRSMVMSEISSMVNR